jgi:hypothetical protein
MFSIKILIKLYVYFKYIFKSTMKYFTHKH